MKQLLLLLILLSFEDIRAIDYSITALPDSIKNNSNAILRNYTIEITINKDLSFTEKTHKVITILNEKANKQANYYGYESKEISSTLKHGIVYDEKGIPFKKIKKSDLNTIAEYSQFISDFKADYYNPQITKFPYTAEYEYETKYNYLLYLPGFNPFQDYNTAVVNANYIIHIPNGCGIRWYNQNNSWKPGIEVKENITTYIFDLKNKPCIKEEINAPDFDKIAPKVIIAPNQISYYGYKEKFDNWNDFGKWIIQLNKGRDSLPASIKEKMQQYKNIYPDLVERAKAIYTWMQDNTRYYSIQLGLGGYQPMKILDVHKKKYGDCKALSFYTKTLFKEAGIAAYYTLVNAGKNKCIVTEIPANQFNHVIVCLPMNNDTIWLECTDQKIPFGYLGNFTDDRDVLVINEHPAIVHTKKYSVNDNTKTITANIVMNEEKNITGSFTYITRGLQYEKLYIAEYLPSKDLQKKYLYELLNVNSLNLKDYAISSDKSIIPQKKLTADFEAGNYSSKVGSKILFEPNLFSKYHNAIKADSNRILPIEQSENYTEMDSIFFLLPKGYFVENNTNTQINSKYVNYSTQTIYNSDNNTLLYTRKLIIYKGTFPASEQKEYVSFINKIISEDNIKVLLRKATP